MIELKHLICPAHQHRKERERDNHSSFLLSLPSLSSLFLWFACGHIHIHAVMNAIHYWGWNGKWSKMSALGSNLWLKRILSSAEASWDVCLSTRTRIVWATECLPVTHIMLFAPPFEIWYSLSLLSSLPFFCLRLPPSLIFIDANANTAWCSFMWPLMRCWSQSVSLSKLYMYNSPPINHPYCKQMPLCSSRWDDWFCTGISDDNLTFIFMNQ